jgi:hypothetical protein
VRFGFKPAGTDHNTINRSKSDRQCRGTAR